MKKISVRVTRSRASELTARQKENATLREKRPSRYGLHWKGKVAGDMARDTKITVASINTCKNRQRGSRRINGGDANFQFPLARRFSIYQETLHARVLASQKKKKTRFHGEVSETSEDRPDHVRVLTMYSIAFF